MPDPCHLQLHGLDVGDVCGACGHPAEAHRGHRAFVRDEAPEQGRYVVIRKTTVGPVVMTLPPMDRLVQAEQMARGLAVEMFFDGVRAWESLAEDEVQREKWMNVWDAIEDAGIQRLKAPCSVSDIVRDAGARMRDLSEANAIQSAKLDELRETIRELRAERDEAIQERDRWIARVQSQERIVRRVREVVG